MNRCQLAGQAIKADAEAAGLLAVDGVTSYGYIVAVHPTLATIGRIQITPERPIFMGDVPDDLTKLAWKRWREQFKQYAGA